MKVTSLMLLSPKVEKLDTLVKKSPMRKVKMYNITTESSPTPLFFYSFDANTSLFLGKFSFFEI